MTKIDVFSGFLGAGKTTLIKKLIADAYEGERLVLIENEFGAVGVDSTFMKDTGVEISEINSGCICCSMSGDFTGQLQTIIEWETPDRVLIEPSGVAKLSDVCRSIQQVQKACRDDDVEFDSLTVVVDATRAASYMENFGEFYLDQIEHADCLILSHTEGMTEEALKACVDLLRQHNANANLITTPWDQLDSLQLRRNMERSESLAEELQRLQEETVCPVCGGYHHDHEHHHHHDDEEEHECGCEHHHHDDEEEHECGCEHHHHDDEEEHECGCKHHHHHHHEGGHYCDHDHDADEVFVSWGKETPRHYTRQELEQILQALQDGAKFGQILRAKGAVSGEGDVWYHFDYLPGEYEIRTGVPAVTGRLCVIGAGLAEQELAQLFNV